MRYDLETVSGTPLGMFLRQWEALQAAGVLSLYPETVLVICRHWDGTPEHQIACLCNGRLLHSLAA